MSETKSYPYETRLDIYYQPIEVIDEKAMSDANTFKWFNQTLCRVNDSVVRLGVFQGEYHWHKHEEDDEFFYVVEGKLIDRSGTAHCRAPAAHRFRGAQRRAAPHARPRAHRGSDG
jgi:uncharacterized cupin superfamily protein